jgi:CIC family chloride channel protein
MGAVSPSVARARLGQIFHDTLFGYLRGLPVGTRRFWLLVPLCGAVSGIAAVGMVHLLEYVEHLAWGPGDFLAAVRGASAARRVLVPLGAGVLVTLVDFVFRRLPRGYGTSQIIESIWTQRGQVSISRAFTRGLMSIVIVGMGASLGREGALIYFGAATGSLFGRRFGLRGDRLKLLVACGGAAGIAAAYNTPLGGALFGLEVFLGGLALELYGPLIFAAITATLISRALLYDHPSYVIHHYHLRRPQEIVLFLLLGAVVGLVSGLFVRVVEGTTALLERTPEWVRRIAPVIGLGIVGMVGLFLPEVYGNGYETVNEALAERLPLRLLIILPFLKLGLSAICASTGAPGGLFTPSLFVGGLCGGALGTLFLSVFPNTAGSSGGYVLVGMGAALAGTTHATLAAALLIFELTGNYEMILPVLGACVVATSFGRRVAMQSIYTAPLHRIGVELPRVVQPAWMQREGIQRLIHTSAHRVRPNTAFEDLLLAMVSLRVGESLYVTDDHGHLHGAISLDSIRQVLEEQAGFELLIAADLMRDADPISFDASLWEVTRRALSSERGELPVVSPREGGRFIGVVPVKEVLQRARTGA